MSVIQTVPVSLSDRSYEIKIGDGLLSDLSVFLDPVIGDGRAHVVTDETVYRLYKSHLMTLDRDLSVTVVPAGEGQKSFTVLQQVLDDMFAQSLSRQDTVIAFGGGVIGDLTGFAASIYKRGCRFVQIPTTLLAQVDSSVGGKTAINVTQGKNLVGAFYQPSLVLTDISVLKTLAERELKAGYSEIVKYGLLGDRKFFNWLEENGQRVLDLDTDTVAQAIATSCETKARIVAQDEREQGVRALLNLGHTFGHALEAEAGYDGSLLHGEAVSAGMEMAFEFSAGEGICADEDAKRVSNHFAKTGLTRISDIEHLLKDVDSLMTHMSQDKKNEAGALTLILATAIGDAFVQKNAKVKAVRNYLQTLL